MPNIPYLQDPIRMHVYEWVLNHIKGPRKVLDVGSRDSGFPSYLSSIGNTVTALERDKSFYDSQLEWKIKFNTNTSIVPEDLLELPNWNKFDTICSLFAIQHNAYKDIDKLCYEKCATLLSETGELFVAHEYNNYSPWIQQGRDDGDLVGYNENLLMARMITPICDIINAPVTIYKKYMKWIGLEPSWCPKDEAMTVCVHILKN